MAARSHGALRPRAAEERAPQRGSLDLANERRSAIPILLIDPRDAIGGDGIVHLQVAEHLDRARYRPVVLCHDRGPLSLRFGEIPGATVISLDCGTRDMMAARYGIRGLASGARGGWRLIRSTKRAIHAARDHAVRLVHSTDTLRGMLLAAAIARALHVPWLLHGHCRPRLGRLARRLALRADVVACVSRWVAEAYAEQGLPSERLAVVPNAVALGRLASGRGPRRESARLAFRRAIGTTPSDRVVGWMGRLSPAKAPERFLEACALVAADLPDVRFVLAGGSEVFDANDGYADHLRRRTRELGLGERLIFTGFVEDAGAALAAFDVLAFTTNAEGFGMVPIEAMACGVPVIASAVGGVLEVIRDGESGLLVPPGCSRRLAEAIVGVLERPSLRTSLIENGLHDVRTRFSMERQMRELGALYEDLLSGGRP